MIRFESRASGPPAPLDVASRFDAAAVWAGLPAARQAEIGAAALALAAAWAAQDEAELGEGRILQTPLGRAASQADMLAIDEIVRLYDTTLPRDVRLTPSGQPRLPTLLGPVCHRCGCSEWGACVEGCGWAAPDLCTACVETGEAQHG